jgi:hypothetical protein
MIGAPRAGEDVQVVVRGAKLPENFVLADALAARGGYAE